MMGTVGRGDNMRFAGQAHGQQPDDNGQRRRAVTTLRPILWSGTGTAPDAQQADDHNRQTDGEKPAEGGT